MQFEGKHEIFLQNPDGSRIPMDEPWFQARKVDEGTWQILSAGDYTYLLEGSSEVLVIDTGYGAMEPKEAEYKRTLEYADCLITYDIRKIREETCCGNRQL